MHGLTNFELLLNKEKYLATDVMDLGFDYCLQSKLTLLKDNLLSDVVWSGILPFAGKFS